MVSLRRRKLLGLCAGRSSVFTPLLHSVKSTISSAGPAQNVKFVAVHPLPSTDMNEPEEKHIINVGFGSLNVSTSSSLKGQQSQLYPEQPIKRRKRHRRKQVHNQEPCLMRGVYYKNMKWQAAIKVDKKQIHLGTVGSQEEAARLYDRAAFMCGREPNFELSEEEKQQLGKFKWDEFLAITRRAINSKKSKTSSGLEMRKKSEPNLESEEWNVKAEINSFSASEEAEPDSSAS